MKINRPVVALRVRAGHGMRGPLRKRSAHRPPERIDRTHRKHRSRAVPARIAQRLAAIFRAERLKSPCRIRAQFRWDAQLAEHLLRFDVARNHQGIAAVALAHFLQQRVHLAGFGAECDTQLVLGGSNPERADHHGGKRVGELALEHRAFARHHAVVLAHLGMQERRKYVRQMNLFRVAKVTTRQIEILSHHAQLEILRAQNSPHLPQHFLHAHIGAGIARSVVAGE